MIALDFGSHSLRMVKMREDGLCIERKEFIVQSAKNLYPDKLIKKAAISRIKAALKELVKEQGSLKEAKAVATAAYRVAKNASLLVEEIKQEFDLDIKIISAKEEAKLSKLALEYELKKLGFEQDFYFCDLGGASMELGFKEAFISLDCGIVTLYEKTLLKPLDKRFLKALVFRAAGGLKKGFFKKNKLKKGQKSFKNTFLKKSLNPSLQRFKMLSKAKLARARAFCAKASFVVMNSSTPSILSAYKEGIFYKDYKPGLIKNKYLAHESFLPLAFKLFKDPNLSSYIGKNKAKYILSGAFLLANLKKDALVIDSGLCEGLCVKELALLKNFNFDLKKVNIINKKEKK